MADGKIEIETRINTKKAEKDAKGLAGIIKKIGGSNLVGNIANIGCAMAALSNPVSMVTKGLGAVKEAIGECTELYKKQESAEKTLEIAARNNPYLNRESVQALKDYAGELQGIGNIGDEELLPYMARLAAAGRTQEEIMSIMSASLDVSASGAMSFESAMNNLNKTFGGFAGELGETVPAIKALSQEELKSGKAVEALSKQYKGMAKELADSSVQLSNSIGDLKETVGQSFAGIKNKMDGFIKGFVDGVNDAIIAKRKLDKEMDSAQKVTENKEQVFDIDTNKEALKGIEKTFESYGKTYKEILNYINLGYEYSDKLVDKINEGTLDIKSAKAQFALLINSTANGVDVYNRIVELTKEKKRIQNEINRQKKEELENEKKASEELEKQKKIAEQNQKDTEATGYKKAYLDTIEAKQKEIELRRATGEEITKEAEAQEMANVKVSSYLELAKHFSDPYEIMIDGKNVLSDVASSYEKLILMMEKAKDTQTKLENGKDIMDSFSFDFSNTDLEELEESYNAQVNYVREMYRAILSDADLNAEQRIELEKSMTEKLSEVDQAYFASEAEKIRERSEALRQAFEDLARSVSNSAIQISNMLGENARKQTDLELGELEEKKNKQLMSDEEYEKEKERIEKEGAEKAYKYEMAAWAMQLTSSIADGAAATIKAFASLPYPANIAAGISTGIACAAQTAVIMENKPVKKFASGGIVPGSSYSGDKVHAMVNSGEMILTREHQQKLFNMIAGGKTIESERGGFSMPVTIINKTDASVKTQRGGNGFEVYIENVVNGKMAKGRFNSAMAKADYDQKGVRYL